MASIRRAQVPVSKQTVPKCPDHNEDVVMVCGKCNNVFICLKCVTTTHEGHSFKQMSEIATDIKDGTLKSIIEAANTQLVPRISMLTDAYKNLRRKNAVTKQQTLTEMKKRVTELKRKLDNELEKMETEIGNEYKTNEKSIDEKVRQYEESLSKLNCMVTDCESLIDSRDSVHTISKAKEKEEEWENIRSLGAHTVDVSLETLHLEHIEISDRQIKNAVGRKLIAPVDVSKELQFPQASVKAVINKRLKIKGFSHKYICSLAALKTDLIWILFSQRDLVLIDKNGSVLQNITIEDEGIADIATTQSNKLLVACFDNHFYTVDVDGYVSVVSTTQTGTWDDEDSQHVVETHSHCTNNVNGISTDKFDNVYSTIYWHKLDYPFYNESCGKAGVYSNLVDKNICTFEEHFFSRDLCPYRVCIENNSGDICMLQMLFTTGKTNIVLCDWGRKEKAKFTESGDSRENHVFTDACFDDKSNLIVSDSSSGSLFVINRQTYNKKRLKIDERKPHALCIWNGMLLVGCEDGSLLFIDTTTVTSV